MQLNSARDPEKRHYYYRQLPDSERRNEESLPMEANRKAGFNRYALAAAILASTNSILLGYGEFYLLSRLLFSAFL